MPTIQDDATGQTFDLVRVGNIVTTPAIAATLPPHARRIKSWDNRAFNNSRAYAAIRELNRYTESRFDAVHGRRFVLMVLPSPCGDVDEQTFRALRRCAFML